MRFQPGHQPKPPDKTSCIWPVDSWLRLKPVLPIMLNYLINSFKRKMARRIIQKQPMVLDTFAIPGIGQVQFAN